MYSNQSMTIIELSIIYTSFYNFLIFFICYSCNIVIKLSGKIPSQVLLLFFPECLHSI